MCFKAVLAVAEAGVVMDAATRQIMDVILDFVPFEVLLFWSGERWGIDEFPLKCEGIEFDHGLVVS